MSDFRKEMIVYGTAAEVTAVAIKLLTSAKIVVKDNLELATTIWGIAHDALGLGVLNIDSYATKRLLLKYTDAGDEPGRIWWDYESDDFVFEADLYREYLCNREDREISFEEYIQNCSVEQNGTLELVRGA